jgi:Ala-tRNA(Pro) deacylase
MPVGNLKDYLDEKGIKYVSIKHPTAFTAQEIAASAHIPGKELAKIVVVKLDGRMAMVVVPATHVVDLDKVKSLAGADKVELATENDFKDVFPGSLTGAMPPFGNIYGIEVFADESLAEDEEIAFNAGSHTELIRLKYKDFEKSVKPKVGTMAHIRIKSSRGGEL